MAKIVTKDNIRTQTAHNADNGDIVIATTQDVTDIVEQNKKEYNNAETKWSDQLFGNKVASIPFTAIDKLNKEGIMKGFQVLDQKRFFAFLNDPENLYFRTKAGKL